MTPRISEAITIEREIGHSTLRGVIAAAADPYERARQQWCRHVPTSGEVIERRRADWANAVTHGDAEALDRLLRVRGIDDTTFVSMLTDVELRDPKVLPRWGAELLAVLEAAPRVVPIDPIAISEIFEGTLPPDLADVANEPWELYRYVAPLTQAAVETIDELAAGTIGIAPGARRQLLVGWARRIADLVVPTLLATPSIGAGAGSPGLVLDSSVLEIFLDPEPDADGWLEVLASYPVLGRLVGTASLFWRESTRELMDRLQADERLVSRSFGSGAPLTELTALRGDAGDVHRSGRAVAVLDLEPDCRVVYKPKNLDIGVATLQLLDGLTEVDTTEHPSRTILSRGSYCWEQFVPTKPTDEAGARRFYRRYGELTRLVQALGGHDITNENLIAHGDRPEIIDLETMARAPSRFADDTLALDLETRRQLLASPGPTAMLSAGVAVDAGRRGFSMSPLDAGDVAETPFRLRRVTRDDDGRMRLHWSYSTLPRDNPIAHIGEVAVDPRSYFDEVAEGYASMDRRLREETKRLVAPGGAIAAMADNPVRFLNRNSFIYSRVLQQSVEPDRLVDGVQREIELDRFWKSLAVDPYGAAFIADEVNAVRQLDIPLFQSVPGTSDVILNDETVVADVFAAPALPTLMARLGEAAEDSSGRNVAIAQSLLHCIDPRPRHERIGHLPPSREPSLEDALDIAREVAGHRTEVEHRVAWLGVGYSPWNDLWTFGPLSYDLLSGAAGIGVTLAEAAVAADDTELHDVAVVTFDTICQRLARALDDFNRKRLEAVRAPTASFVVGGLMGVGAQMHGAARIARVLDLDRGRAVLSDALERIDVEIIRLMSADDAVGGLPGFVYNLSEVAAYLDDGRAEQIMNELTADRSDPLRSAQIPEGAWILDDLPTAEASWRAACNVAGGQEEPTATDFLRTAHPEMRTGRQLLRDVDEGQRGDAHRVATLGELVRRRDGTGSCFPELRVDPRYYLSATFGLCAVVRALLRECGDVRIDPLMLPTDRR